MRALFLTLALPVASLCIVSFLIGWDTGAGIARREASDPELWCATGATSEDTLVALEGAFGACAERVEDCAQALDVATRLLALRRDVP